MSNFSFVVGLDEMFLNKNWSTIDTVLTSDTEDSDRLPAALGDGVKEVLIYMALSKDMPEEIKRKHLPKLIALVDFGEFARAIRVKLASIPRMPVRKEIERMLAYNALPELKWAISHMDVEEINGLLDFFIEKVKGIDLRISIALILRMYDGQIISRETLLLTLAEYCIADI